MYEHHEQPLLSKLEFFWRMLRHMLLYAALILVALGVGTAGYHWLEGFGWVEAVLNASMILGGMGPVDTLQTTAGKLFASGYALFSGLVFVVAMGVIFAPVIHRILHKFHVDGASGDGEDT